MVCGVTWWARRALGVVVPGQVDDGRRWRWRCNLGGLLDRLSRTGEARDRDRNWRGRDGHDDFTASSATVRPPHAQIHDLAVVSMHDA